MKPQFHQKIPSLQRLLNYIHHRMNPAARHTMERRFQQDAFLEEAVEGLSMTDERVAIKTAERLKRQIRPKSSNPKIVWVGRIAAGLAIMMLSGITYLAVNRIKQSEHQHQLSREEKTVIIPDQALIETPARDTMPEYPTTPIPEKKAKEPQDIMADPDRARSGASASQGATRPTAEPIKSADRISQSFAADRPSTIHLEAERTSTDISRIMVLAEEPAVSNGERKLKGKIIDSHDGQAIPGVSIHIAGTTKGTITDLHGNFEIIIPAGKEVNLVASFIGMETLAFSSSALDKHAVLAMESDVASLSEIVVIGYGTRRGVDPDIASGNYRNRADYIPASPEGGYRAYNAYLRERARIPEGTGLRRAVVVVRFEVNPQGSPVNLEIVQSPGAQFDQKAREIIEQGPDWTPARLGQTHLSESIRLRIVFR